MKVKTETKKIGKEYINLINFTDSGLEIIIYDDLSNKLSIKNNKNSILIETNNISSSKEKLSKEIDKINKFLLKCKKTLKILNKFSNNFKRTYDKYNRK